MNTIRHLLGYVAVDTARVVIGDPHYLTDHIDLDFPDDGVMHRLSEQYPESLNVGLAIVSRTGFGDGVYSVYADVIHEPDERLIHGRVARLEIEFITEDDLESRGFRRELVGQR
jgi:hypothetical protein